MNTFKSKVDYYLDVSEMSAHYRCRYLILDSLRRVDVANHTG